MRRALPLLLLLLLPACGGGGSKATTPATPAAAVGQGAKTLFQGSGWAVVTRAGHAVAVHRVGEGWQVDRSGKVKIRILGPSPGSSAARRPQVAAELSAGAPLVESGLWVDGHELLEKGGGLSPKKGTIYGAPDRSLAAGRHTVVAYARTATAASAVAWSFRVV